MKTHMQTHTLEHLWGRDRHWDLHPAEYCIQLSTVHLMKQVKFVYVDLNHEFAKKKKKKKKPHKKKHHGFYPGSQPPKKEVK